MSVFGPLEAELAKVWGVISGEARAAAEAALADAKDELSKLESQAASFEAEVRTAVGQAESDLKGAVAGAEPGVKANVEQLVSGLVAKIEGIASHV